MYLPPEILVMTMAYCDQDTLRTLALCSKLFRTICTPLLYKRDLQSFVPRSVTWAISECEDDSVSLRVLENAQQSGADFQRRLPYDCFLGQFAIELAVLLGRDKIIAYLLDGGFHDRELIDDGSVWAPLPFNANQALPWELDTSRTLHTASDLRFQQGVPPLVPSVEIEPTPLYFASWFPMTKEETLLYVYEAGTNSPAMTRGAESKHRRMFVVKAKPFRPRCNFW
ncbi:hypothetical protein CORC01_10802 [Colletotrichum orchidophilum]|uniref:Uncharacterized protein n=1 Tax=Colletotrichum orchidophilum TaxID=1209926 RepID=A0A1G4AXT9_9PEZI|nr:uncharacterized protein CORC01_10802 [Colletotrichum orchidophilum]OHE93903.1 hypothetical protein CORC01_10802 [Colletotrichum orchidophilum]